MVAGQQAAEGIAKAAHGDTGVVRQREVAGAHGGHAVQLQVCHVVSARRTLLRVIAAERKGAGGAQ